MLVFRFAYSVSGMLGLRFFKHQQFEQPTHAYVKFYGKCLCVSSVVTGLSWSGSLSLRGLFSCFPLPRGYAIPFRAS